MRFEKQHIIFMLRDSVLQHGEIKKIMTTRGAFKIPGVREALRNVLLELEELE